MLIAIVNQQILKQMNSLTAKNKEVIPLAQKKDPEVQAQAVAVMGHSILRVERKDSKADYTESVILIEKEEVARFKIKNGKMTDLTGEIPKEKIKFVNKWQGTYGFEYYQGNKRHGAFEEYYNNGNIKEEAEYSDGRLLTQSTYFLDGGLRMEQDFTEARFMAMRIAFGNLEYVGIGKIYRPDGSVKFEWQIVDNSESNYTRVYNTQGAVIEEKHFDAQGDPITPLIPIAPAIVPAPVLDAPVTPSAEAVETPLVGDG